MAYTILDNKAAVLATRGPVTGSKVAFDFASYRSGLMSPNGEILAISTRYRNGKTGDPRDHGIDFRKSGSEGHMDLISSIPLHDDVNCNVADMVWVNNKELIFSTTDSDQEFVVVTASAGGTDFGIHKTINRADGNDSSALKLEISADKTAILGYHDPGANGDQYVWVFNSSSDDHASAGWNWTQTVRVTNQTTNDVYSARWLRTNDEFAVGTPTENKLFIVHRTGSSLDGWPSYVPSAPASQVQEVTGANAGHYFGQQFEWHTGSDSLVIFDATRAEVHESSSQGYSGKNQPAFRLTGSAFDSAGGGQTGYTSKIYKNSIFYRLDASYNSSLSIDSVYVLEKGDNTGGYPGGWRAEFLTQSGQAGIYNLSPQFRGAQQIYIGGGVLSLAPGLNANNNPGPLSEFHIFTTGLGAEGASEPTSLNNQTTSSVVASAGGIVQAGNTDANPDVQVYIPASALAGNTTVKVEKMVGAITKGQSITQIIETPSRIIAPRAASDIFRFLPHGTSFSSPVIISFKVTGSTSNIKIFRRATQAAAWAEISADTYTFASGKVHITASSFSDYFAVGGGSMPLTKIGTKLISDSAITTVKLGASAITRADIQSASVQVTHLDLSSQARADHVDFVDDDFFIAGDATNNNARGFSFSQLKTALSLSNAARGDEGSVQFNNGAGFDGIAKIRTDGVHLTASDGGKVAFAFTGISGSTGEIFADSKTGLTVNAKTTLSLNINGADELEINATVAQPATNEGLNLGAADRKYSEVHSTVLSGSSTSTIHKADTDELDTRKLVAVTVTGSGNASLHKLDVDEGTFNNVLFSSARDAASFMITGSGTAQAHKIDVDEGTFNKLIATVLTGSGTSALHKVNVDEGTIDRVIAAVVSGSGTSTLHKLDVDEIDARRVVTTNITSSGTSNLHVVTANDLSGSSGKFHKIVVDDLSARKITSGVSTSEFFEVPQKQYIAFASGSSGASAEGAGLQIGGTAGSGSSGVASVVLGDAGSGAGKDLLLKIGTTQGASLSGSVSDGGQRFGVTGSISGSVGIFHSVTIATAMGNQDAIFSGSSFSAQTVTGALAQIFDLDVNQANIRDVDGTSATFTTVSGTTVQAHTLDTDKLTGNDVDGTSATITGIISGSTVDAHTIDVDKLEIRDLDFVNLSGSATATIHKVTSDVISGSKGTVHNTVTDKLNIIQITSTDVVTKAQLNEDIVQANGNAHGGLDFVDGQLSVGWKRRIFSRSSKKIVNRTQPTQGSGSLFTTCSLADLRMVSGSEMVYFNGLLLVKSNGAAGNPRDGDYRIDYNGFEIFLHESLAMDSDDVVVVQYLSGTHPSQ